MILHGLEKITLSNDGHGWSISDCAKKTLKI